MKIQLDTTAKTIKVEESVNLGELTTALEKLLPEGLWKEFKLETATVINWGSYQPIIIRDYTNPYPWWKTCIITYANQESSHQKWYIGDNLNSGVYNVMY